MMTPEDTIRAMARDAAVAGLKLDHARGLFDAQYVTGILVAERGNKTAAAERAGITRETLWRMMSRLGLAHGRGEVE